jgi:hypothetical protein
MNLQTVALAHGGVVGVDLPHPGLPQPRVDLLQVAPNQLLLGLGDAAAVRLAGMLQGGVADLTPLAAGPSAPPTTLRYRS